MKSGGRNASRPRPPHDWFDAQLRSRARRQCRLIRVATPPSRRRLAWTCLRDVPGLPPREKGRAMLKDVVVNLSGRGPRDFAADRKSTRLNSSHLVISYAVFCLKK